MDRILKQSAKIVPLFFKLLLVRYLDTVMEKKVANNIYRFLKFILDEIRFYNIL